MYTCPVCGYDQLDLMPYNSGKAGSYDICDCCGFQFGVTDDDKKYTFESYREEWILNGAKWFDPESKPNDCNLKGQLRNINITI